VELPRSLTLVGVTDALARELVSAIERADECTISTWNEADDTLANITTYERDEGFNEHYRDALFPLCDWPESRNLLREATAFREYRGDDPGWKPHVRELLETWLWKTWISLPLVVEGRSVGLIEIIDYVTTDRWSPRDIVFCQTIASQAAMAVRNAQLYEHLQRQVERDPLTGLLNHRALHERVAADLAEAQLRGGELALIAIDLDDFKGVNDRDGHLAGDQLLRQVADVLREACREQDAAGRVGGDEFILSLPGLGGDAAAVAERLVAAISRRTGTCASAGVARARPDELDAASLIDRADRALIEAKRAGKDTFRLSA
jgi:diguanylate cyclase (GGDEF)-like protein